MSPAAYPSPLRAERGGLADSIDLPTTRRMSPAEISLTLSADVLRLPYPPATRLVLAEIVSLHAANAGCCDASDAHFAARLTLSINTVSRAIQQLETDKLVIKHVDKSAGFYRTLKPVPAAIAAQAQTNPYPQNAGSYPQNGGRGTTPKNGVGYPQNEGSPTPKMGSDLPPKWGTNTPSNIPDNFHQSSISSATASDAPVEKKIEEDFSSTALPAEVEVSAPPVAVAPPAKKSRAKKSDDEPEHFADFWAAYLRHDDRAGAVKAFARLTADEQAAAPDWAARWLARRTDWISPEGADYRPYAATWLRNKRWLELAEPLPTPSSTASTATSHVTYHANHRQRPTNGAKPDADAGELAAALFDHIGS